MPAKGGVYSQDKEVAARVAAALSLPHRAEGIVAAGTPIGTDAFVAAHAEATCAAAREAMQTLHDLPPAVLPLQDKLLLLRCSLQQRVLHLPRCAPWPLSRRQ